MVRLVVRAALDGRLMLLDGDGNVQTVLDNIEEIFRHVKLVYNSYTLEIDSTVVNLF